MSTPTAASLLAPSVAGPVRRLLRAEGIALLGAALVAYGASGHGWGLFAMLFLIPDVSLGAYLIGPRAGAAAYNAMHTLSAPLVLGAIAVIGHAPLALAVAFVWVAHIGMDRALGYGLKYPSAFGHTHLGKLGAPARAEAVHAEA